MSGFLLGYDHIAAIIGTYYAMRDPQQDKNSNPRNDCALLYLENVRSFNTANPQCPIDIADMVDSAAEFTAAQIREWEQAPLSIGQFFAAVNCYKYNAGQSEIWKTSDAFEMCERMTARAASLLPDYATCPYGISSPAPLRAVKPSSWEIHAVNSFARRIKPPGLSSRLISQLEYEATATMDEHDYTRTVAITDGGAHAAITQEKQAS